MATPRSHPTCAPDPAFREGVPGLDESLRALGSVPPSALPDAVVELVATCAKGPVGLYVVDVAGVGLTRLAGSEALPPRFEALGALGPELDRAAIDAIVANVATYRPDATVSVLWVLRRAMGAIIACDAADDPVERIARVAAPLLELASGFTDVIERGRRVRAPTAAAELQLEMLSPRVACVGGGRIAASVLPAYDVGGDWFDHVDNPDAVWLAIGDAMGKGPAAAALSALALSALRSARRDGGGLGDCASAMHDVVAGLPGDGFVTAWLGRWRPATGRLSWINRGHPPALLLRDGSVRELAGARAAPLGVDSPAPVHPAPLAPGPRLLLHSDGISERRMASGARYGTPRLADLLVETAERSPAAAVGHIEDTVANAGLQPPHDDATQLLLAVDAVRAP